MTPTDDTNQLHQPITLTDCTNLCHTKVTPYIALYSITPFMRITCTV